MGTFIQGKENSTKMNKNAFYGYYCKEYGSLPLLYFSLYDFSICCLNHKILNIPTDEFYNFIIFDYVCSICKKSYPANNVSYCYECNNYYCDNCIKKHTDEHNKNINLFHSIINSYEKYTICFLHNKKYNKFCLKCKVNLCELCQNHNRHYIKEFNSIYPLDEDIEIFY